MNHLHRGSSLPAGAPTADDAAGLALLVRRLRRTHPQVWEHCIRVGAIMGMLATRPGGAPAFDWRLAVLSGVLHDVGKLMLPRALLHKPQTLTVRDRSLLAQHVTVGRDLLGASGAVPTIVLDAALYHHERADGSGYPFGLLQDSIPAIARLCAVADTFDAMTATDRTYRLPRTSAQALAAVVRSGATLFDPAVVDLLRHTRLSELDQLRNVDQARKRVHDVLRELETGVAAG